MRMRAALMAFTIWRRWLRGGPAARSPPTARTGVKNQNLPGTGAGMGLPAPAGGMIPLPLCVGLPVFESEVILLWSR